MKYSIDIIERALDKYFKKYSIIKTRELSMGVENTNVLAYLNNRVVVVRFYGKKHAYVGKRKDTHILYELELMMFFKSKGIPIPQVYKSLKSKCLEKIVIDHSRYSYAVIEFVEGDTPTDFNKSMINEIAQTMARMHTIVKDFKTSNKRTWPGTMVEMANDRIKKLKILNRKFKMSSPKIRNVLNLSGKWLTNLKHVDLSVLPNGPIHGDIMLENIKFKENKITGIFDFDDCRESYFLEDISKTLLFRFESPKYSLFGLDGKNVNYFIKSYEKIRVFSKQEKKLLPLFFQTRAIYELTGYILKNDDIEIIDEKINKYLNRYNKFINFFN